MRFFADAATTRRAREAFDAAGYTADRITERLGPHLFAHLGGGELAPLRRATRGGDRLDVLARLFLLGEPVPLGAAAAALAPLPLEAWAAGGLVEVDGDGVSGRLSIRPLGGAGDRLVAYDRRARDGGVRPDHVLGVGASTAALAGATIRRPVDAALDVGTGCGVHALDAAAHSARVVATDLNPRAVACATLTMELNGIGNVDVRAGDLFEPVEGERFDLVVSNPPFVVSPSRRYLFRDSGRSLDDMCRTIVRDVPRFLRDGGFCQLLASWLHVRGEDWRDRLATWFDGIGCDALVLEREALDSVAHAASWLRQTDQADDWADFDAWVDLCEHHGVEAIGFGLITMQRRGDGDGPAWFRAESAPQDFAMPCGDHLGAAFELAELSRSSDDAALAELTVKVAPDVVLDERSRPGPDGWNAVGRTLRQTAGLCREGEVDAVVAALVGGCDGRRPLGEVLRSALDGEPAVPPGAALAIARRLLEQGFLLPAMP